MECFISLHSNPDILQIIHMFYSFHILFCFVRLHVLDDASREINPIDSFVFNREHQKFKLVQLRYHRFSISLQTVESEGLISLIDTLSHC